MSIRRVAVSVLIVSATLLGEVAAADLRQKTLDAWERYILRTEARIGAEVGSGERECREMGDGARGRRSEGAFRTSAAVTF